MMSPSAPQQTAPNQLVSPAPAAGNISEAGSLPACLLGSALTFSHLGSMPGVLYSLAGIGEGVPGVDGC